MTLAEQRRIGTEIRIADGREERIGRDPRQMTQEELRALGHERLSPMAAIRAHCLDCCGGSPNEVRACIALRCPSWPYRIGANPWRAPASEERKEAARRLAAQMHERRRNHGHGSCLEAGTGEGFTTCRSRVEKKE